MYRAHGRHDEALKYQKAALELHRQGAATDPFTLLQSLNAVAVVYQRLNDLSRGAILHGTRRSRYPPRCQRARRVTREDFLRANMAAMLTDLGDMAPGRPRHRNR